MNCSECGVQLTGAMKFCPNCGTAQNQTPNGDSSLSLDDEVPRKSALTNNPSVINTTEDSNANFERQSILSKNHQNRQPTFIERNSLVISLIFGASVTALMLLIVEEPIGGTSPVGRLMKFLYHQIGFSGVCIFLGVFVGLCVYTFCRAGHPKDNQP
jgi:hypothetical protein